MRGREAEGQGHWIQTQAASMSAFPPQPHPTKLPPGLCWIADSLPEREGPGRRGPRS